MTFFSNLKNFKNIIAIRVLPPNFFQIVNISTLENHRSSQRRFDKVVEGSSEVRGGSNSGGNDVGREDGNGGGVGGRGVWRLDRSYNIA